MVDGTMQPISKDLAWHFRRCDGYLDLGMVDRAREEMAHIPSKYHDTPLYRQLRLRFAMESNAWAEAADLAQALCGEEPGEAGHWLQLAFATRRAHSLEAARSILRRALKRFPREALIPFNLACYECQLGHPDQALHYLGKAEALAPQCRHLALRDEDLKPLWDQLGAG
jgi:predicted Zn-dependent protease